MCVCLFACVWCVRSAGGGRGGGVEEGGTGVNLLWQDVALLPYEGD